MIDYSKTKENFYEEQSESSNPLQAWFHSSRNRKTLEFVKKYFTSSDKIVDLGCGNTIWNTESLPVTGVDVNDGFLNLSLSKQRLTEKVVSAIDQTGLPDGYAGVVVITEVLEHIENLPVQMKEIWRILKPGGIVVSSVPYDTFFSFWKPLFALQCFYRGTLLGEEYYKTKCGHINNFSPAKMRELFSGNNFKVVEQFNNLYFNIFTIAKKQS